MKRYFALAAVALTTTQAAWSLEPHNGYLKFEGGYNFGFNTSADTEIGTSVTSTNSPLQKQSSGFNSSFGLGYSFNDALRGEISLDWNPNNKFIINDLGLESELNRIGASGTFYYGWNNNTFVTPFIFWGVGVQKITNKITPTTKGRPNLSLDPQTSLALQDLDENLALVDAKSFSSKSLKDKTVMRGTAGLGLEIKGSDCLSLMLKYGISRSLDYTLLSNLAIGTIAAAGDQISTEDTNSLIIKNIKLKSPMEQVVTIGINFNL